MKHFVTFIVILTPLIALAQTPQLPFNPDENGDGLIGVADLQSFLALYNTEFSAAVSNNGIAFLNLGALNKPDCITACNNLSGKWKVSQFNEVYLNWQLFADAIGGWDPDAGGTSNDSEYFWLTTGKSDDLMSESPDAGRFDDGGSSYWEIDSSGLSNGSSFQCVCSITERPKIEYQRIAQDGSDTYMNTIVNEFLNEGWYIQSNDELYMHLWRWKD